MKKLTVTATSVNKHVEFAIIKGPNGLTTGTVMLTRDKVTALRDELTRILET